MVTLLLKQKQVSANVKDSRGWTPLHCCVFSNANTKILAELSTCSPIHSPPPSLTISHTHALIGTSGNLIVVGLAEDKDPDFEVSDRDALDIEI